MMTAVNTKPA